MEEGRTCCSDGVEEKEEREEIRDERRSEIALFSAGGREKSGSGDR